MYAVMKLIKEVSFVSPSGGEISAGPIQGLHGFIPVYETLEEAEAAAEEGKFDIMMIE